MIILYISLGILFLLMILCLIIYSYIIKMHNKLFNHKFIPDPLIKYYDKDEEGLSFLEYDINNNDEIIKGGFYSYKEYDNNKLIIFCHGMDSTIGAYMQDISYFAHHGYLVYGFNYFGTDNSSSTLKGFGNSLYCLNLVINKLKEDDNYKNKELIIIGHSWGGYAATNIISIHKDIKCVVALAPMVCVDNMLKQFKVPKLFRKLLISYDNKKCSGYSKYNGLNSINNYSNKCMILQSKNDPVISFDNSLNYIKNNTINKNVEYLILDNKYHNPNYTDEGLKIMVEFVTECAKYKDNKDKLEEIKKNTDYHTMGSLDEDVMNKILDFIK